MFKQLAVLCFTLPLTVLASDLSDLQAKELTVFAGKSMGSDVEVSDIKKVLPRADINKLVAAGININGFLCASVTGIRAMKVKSVYEVTCIAYRNGTAKKTYMVDALKGIAFEP